ncbi:MAG: NAD(P)-binding domain-containing protein, partial [Holophagales bacterium]|nr:NAD(P)-binding domain-containing protein [Holophagales bacterium]
MKEPSPSPANASSPAPNESEGTVAADLVVIGAGPVGLACAIEAERLGLSARVIEKGPLVCSLVGYPDRMELFSTPDLIEIGGHPFATARYKPTREEAIDYYRGVAKAEGLQVRLYERVLALHGERERFEVVTEKGSHRCRRVVVATGFFDVPNRLGLPGA